jgi:hypothetical protein
MTPRIDMKFVRPAGFGQPGIEIGGRAAQTIAIADIQIDPQLPGDKRLDVGVDAVERTDRRAVRADRAEGFGIARRQQQRLVPRLARFPPRV